MRRQTDEEITDALILFEKHAPLAGDGKVRSDSAAIAIAFGTGDIEAGCEILKAEVARG